MKMKTLTTTFLIIMLLLLTACSNTNRYDEDIKLQSGNRGLTMEFQDRADLEMREESSGYLTFDLRNQGFFDIANGILVPSIDRSYLEIESWRLPKNFHTSQDIVMFENLKGKSLFSPEGEKQTISTIFKAKKIDETRNKVESTIVFTACFPYKTVFSETICIDTDPSEVSVAQKTCESEDITQASGQGAPVAITKVEQHIIPSSSDDSIRVQFTIYAENKDDGIVIDSTRYNEICTGESSGEDDYNIIKLKTLKFSEYEFEEGLSEDLECQPNPLKQTKKSFYTTCTLKEENAIPKSRFTFETPLVIELSYGYKIAESKDIEITNNIEED